MAAISPKQAGYLSDLLDSKDLTASPRYNGGDLDQMKQAMREMIPTLTMQQATEAIDRLKELPWDRERSDKPGQQELLPGVPEGRYALEVQGEARFYKVDRPSKGKYMGYTFLAELSGDNHRPIKDRATKIQILQDIADDIEGAARRYGHYRKECGYCRKSLTDPFSRYFGVGPHCRREHNMPISRAAFLRERPELSRHLFDWENEDAAVAR